MRRTPLVIVAVALLLAFMPRLGLPAFYDSLLYLMLHWVVLATSWNILSGYTGYFSFGHGAFFGAGLYTTSTLLARYDWPFLWTLPVAAAVAAVLGVALGAVVFRVQERARRAVRAAHAGDYLRSRHDRRQHADRRRPGRVAERRFRCRTIGPTPSSTFYLLALAAATLHAARRLGDLRLDASARACSPSTTTRTPPR